MAILFGVTDPRRDLLARYDDEILMSEAATSKQVKKSHSDRADAYRASLAIVDCYVRGQGEPVALRSLDEVRDDVVGGGIVRG